MSLLTAPGFTENAVALEPEATNLRRSSYGRTKYWATRSDKGGVITCAAFLTAEAFVVESYRYRGRLPSRVYRGGAAWHNCKEVGKRAP